MDKKKISIVKGNFQYLNSSNSWILVQLEVDVSSSTLTIYNKKIALLQVDLEFIDLKEDESWSGSGDRSFEVSALGEIHTLKCSPKIYEKWIPKLKQLKSGKRDLSTSQFQDLDEIELVEKEEENENDPKTPLTQSRYLYEDLPETVFDRNNALAKLPDETLVKIWSYLDPRDIGRLARVCKRFKRVSYDLPLWRELFINQHWNKYQDVYQAQSKMPTRSFFVKQFLSFNRREKEAKERLAEHERQQALTAAKKKAASLMVWFGWSRVYEWIICLTVLWVTIIGALKLDEKINWDWPIVLIPAYIAVPPIILNPLTRLFAQWRYDHDFEDDLDPEHDEDRTLGPICFTLFYIFPLSLKFGGFFVPAMGVSFGTWILLLIIRLASGATQLKWWIVFLPMFCWQLLIIGAFIVGNHETIFKTRRRFDRIMCIILILLSMAFFVLLTLQLDNYIDWSWHVIMSPLYALKCLVAFTAVCLSITAILENCCCSSFDMEHYTIWGEEPWGWCAGCAVISSFLIVPLLTFEVLLAQRLDDERDTRYVLIFIPMFLLEGFMIIMTGVLNVVFCCD